MEIIVEKKRKILLEELSELDRDKLFYIKEIKLGIIFLWDKHPVLPI